SPPHLLERGSTVIDLNRLEVSGEFKDVFRCRDRSSSKPCNANGMPGVVGVLGNPLVPGISEKLNEIIKRCGITYLLERQGIRKLIIDGRRKSLNLGIEQGLRPWARRRARLEQVLDVPCHDFEHKATPFIRPGSRGERTTSYPR